MTGPDDVLGYHPDCGHELAGGYEVLFSVDDEGGVQSACDARIEVVEADLDAAEGLGCHEPDCENHHERVRESLRRTALRHCGAIERVDD